MSALLNLCTLRGLLLEVGLSGSSPQGVCGAVQVQLYCLFCPGTSSSLCGPQEHVMGASSQLQGAYFTVAGGVVDVSCPV
jgi:hypothetical protein